LAGGHELRLGDRVELCQLESVDLMHRDGSFSFFTSAASR
jgi:hypothetical protein